MAGQSWMESSLQRSSKLGLEVLERAKRRSVDWSTARQSSQKHHEVQSAEVLNWYSVQSVDTISLLYPDVHCVCSLKGPGRSSCQ